LKAEETSEIWQISRYSPEPGYSISWACSEREQRRCSKTFFSFSCLSDQWI